MPYTPIPEIDIPRFLARAKELGADRVVVRWDWFTNEYEPVYVMPGHAVPIAPQGYKNIEVINLTDDAPH